MKNGSAVDLMRGASNNNLLKKLKNIKRMQEKKGINFIWKDALLQNKYFRLYPLYEKKDGRETNIMKHNIIGELGKGALHDTLTVKD
jgi:hypothetical protein